MPTQTPPRPAAPADTVSPESATAGLVGVAALWGTYSPAMRFIFTQEGAPTPAAVTAVRGVVQCGLLAAGATLANGGSDARSGDAPLAPPPPLPVGASPLATLLRAPAATALTAGLEIGFFNFVASILQAQGVVRTTATEAAFVVSATSLLTPALAAAAGQPVGRAVWGGCGLALAGTALLALDRTSAAATAAPDALTGDAFVLAAACFYSLQTYRLSIHAPRFASTRLALYKSASFAAAATVWAALGAAAGLGRDDVTALAAPPVAAALLWTAAGPGAAAAWLQARGQAVVPSARAQTIYALNVVASAGVAAVVLGETLGGSGWAGGAAIVAGGLLASRDGKK